MAEKQCKADAERVREAKPGRRVKVSIVEGVNRELHPPPGALPPAGAVERVTS